MNGKPWTPYDTATLHALHKTHHAHEIAAKTGHSTVTVQYRLRALGLEPYCGSRYGRWEDLPPSSLEAIKRAAQAS